MPPVKKSEPDLPATSPDLTLSGRTSRCPIPPLVNPPDSGGGGRFGRRGGKQAGSGVLRRGTTAFSDPLKRVGIDEEWFRANPVVPREPRKSLSKVVEENNIVTCGFEGAHAIGEGFLV